MVKVGLALGSGAARGWAHIGVIRQLESWGIYPDVVSGCSIGALVGGCLASKKLEKLEQWACSLRKSDVAMFFDINFEESGGPVKGERLLRLFQQMGFENQIENMHLPFTAVATDLKSGEEVWLRKGSFLQALRASASLPGFLSPLRYQGQWLVDGGLVNPVPTNACRLMEADFIISVNLNEGIIKAADWNKPSLFPSAMELLYAKSRNLLPENFQAVFEELLDLDKAHQTSRGPSYLEVIYSIIAIMQDQITKHRIQLDHADIILTPNLQGLGLFDFDTAGASIQEGIRCTKMQKEQIIEGLQQLGYQFHH